MAAMLPSRAVLRSLALHRSSTLRQLRQPLYRRPLSQRLPEPMEFIYKHWEDLTPAAHAAERMRTAVKVEGKEEEETESQKWERARRLIQKHLEENPMPMSPVRAYYVLRRELFEIMEKDAPSQTKPLKVNEVRLRPRKPGEQRDLPSGRGRRRSGSAGAPAETMKASGRRSAKQSKFALTLQSQQSPSGTEEVGIEAEVKAVKEAAETNLEEKAADKSQDPALKEAAETKPEEKAADKSQDPAVKEAAETKPEEKAADKSQDPAVKEAAETKLEEKAADKSQDPALKEAADTKPEEKAADKSQDPALKEAAETKLEEKAADKSQDPALKEAAETKLEEKAADKSQDPAVKEAAETKPEEKAADKSQDPAVKEAAETNPEEKGVDNSEALAPEDTGAELQRSQAKKRSAAGTGRTARRQQAEEKRQLADLREQLQQGDYAKFNEFVLDQLGQKKTDSSIFSDFIRVYQEERYRKRQRGLRDRLKRKNVRKSFGSLNRGYEEPEEEYEAEEEEFQDEWREKSILEDYWKAEQYRALHQRLREDLPERQFLAAERTDRMADVLQSAFRKEYAEQHRPVLTHELADYENPYMLKRSAMERLLQERCVRNQLDERVMPRLLDQHPDLVKLRRQAALPPEALEPLSAFRGDVRWHFDARQRLEQKLQGVDQVLNVIEAKGNATVDQLRNVLPEKRAENPPENQLEGVRHPWRNHLGFESAVPRGVAGGTKFGQPEPELVTQLAKMRYPTLQRVAHTLPKDPKYRAHVVRSIRVLERSRDWDFQSKLNAINRMKEIYDTMKDSQEYMSGLDEKLVVNRVPSHIKRKYAKDVQYVKHYPKMWYKNKSFFRYRPSLTATAPLGKKKK